MACRTTNGRRAVCAFFCMILSCSAARADVTLTFSEPDFDWLAQGSSATPYHIWTAGDFWTQTFNGTAQPSAAHMGLRLLIDDNLLSVGNHLDMNVLLNNNVIGAFSI